MVPAVVADFGGSEYLRWSNPFNDLWLFLNYALPLVLFLEPIWLRSDLSLFVCLASQLLHDGTHLLTQEPPAETGLNGWV